MLITRCACSIDHLYASSPSKALSTALGLRGSMAPPETSEHSLLGTLGFREANLATGVPRLDRLHRTLGTFRESERHSLASKPLHGTSSPHVLDVPNWANNAGKPHFKQSHLAWHSSSQAAGHRASRKTRLEVAAIRNWGQSHHACQTRSSIVAWPPIAGRLVRRGQRPRQKLPQVAKTREESS